MSACIGFSGNIYCNEAISWSSDNRLALSSGDGIKILTPKCRADDERPDLSFHQSCIPIPTEVWDIPKLSREQYTEIRNRSREDYSAVVLDRLMNPLSNRSVPMTGYCAARWSPPGADHINRSIIAALSHDHRLCLYTQGPSLLDWTKICDLSETARALAVPEMPSWSRYTQFRDWCYQQAAVGICWLQEVFVDTSGTSHALLAVTMATGHLVVWKVGMPCNDGSQCSIVLKTQPHNAYPTAVTCNNSGLMAIGYVDGQVHSVQIDGVSLDTDSPPPSRPIYVEADLLRVSCLCFSSCKKRPGETLVVSKEDCILAFQLSTGGDVLHSTHLFGENRLHGTGMCEVGDWILMSSADGQIQRIQIDTGAAGLSLTTSMVEVPVEERYSWTCSGVTCSPNSVFVAYSLRPSSLFDHLEVRQPIQVHVQPLPKVMEVSRSQWQAQINSQLMEDNTGLSDIADVVEAFRVARCLDDTSWLDNRILGTGSIKFFQLQRLSAMWSYSMTEQQQPGMNKSTARLPGSSQSSSWNVCENADTVVTASGSCDSPDTTAIMSLSERILTMYIQTAVQALMAASRSALTQRETTILQEMFCFISTAHQPSSDSNNTTKASISECLGRVVKNETLQQTQCCVCSSPTTVDRLQSRCYNGHTFGVCCKTLLPCDDIDYRTCIVCDAQALPVISLKDITWLPDVHHCTLCGGLLV